MKRSILRGRTVWSALAVSVAVFSLPAARIAAAAGSAGSASAVRVPENALSAVETMQEAFRAVADGVLPSVVEVDVVEKKQAPDNPLRDMPFFFFGEPNDERSSPREYEQHGLGSGVIVRKTGKTYYVLTNNHVAGTATDISVKLKDGQKLTGKLVGADERKDVALVSFESDDSGIPVAALGDSDAVRTGDICFAMGTPLHFASSVTQGIVSAVGRSASGTANISDFIQTDAAINQGNSGGPLVNIYGEVIGINTWIASQSGGSQGLGFAIAINNVKKAIDDFISRGKVTYGWVGVALSDLSKEYKKELGVGDKNGAFVSQIYRGSPAQKGGMQAGDFIVSLNRRPVETVNQLVRSVGDLTVGENAQFEVLRGGKTVSVKVKADSRKTETSVEEHSAQLWPGCYVVPLTGENRKQLKIDGKVKGVLVSEVAPKSPAAAMRVQSGDVITAVNDKKVNTVEEFYRALDLNGKTEVWFDVYNGGHTIATSRYKLK